MNSPVQAGGLRPAVIIKFDQNPLHHGTLGAIRSLGRAGVPVHLVQESVRLPVNRSRYLAQSLAWPEALSGPRDAIDFLSGLARRIGGHGVLFALDDVGAIFLSEHGDALAGAYDIARQRPSLARMLVDKHLLARACVDAGVAHPQTLRPASWPELVDGEPAGGRWPVVLKRIAPWVPPGVPGLPSVCRVEDRKTLASLAQAAVRPDPGLLVQEYIPQVPNGDWFFHAYYDPYSVCRFAGTGVKLRSWPAYTGSTTYGRVAPRPAVRAQVQTLLGHLRYTGIVDVDLRFDPRTGDYHVLDVNPRLGAQHRLFAGSGDLDLLRAAHGDLTGCPVPAGSPAEGRTFVAENLDGAAARRYMRDGHTDLRGWWRELRSADEYAWIARDDPAPFASMVLRSVSEGVRRRLRGGRRHAPSRSLNEVMMRALDARAEGVR